TSRLPPYAIPHADAAPQQKYRVDPTTGSAVPHRHRHDLAAPARARITGLDFSGASLAQGGPPRACMTAPRLAADRGSSQAGTSDATAIPKAPILLAKSDASDLRECLSVTLFALLPGSAAAPTRAG